MCGIAGLINLEHKLSPDEMRAILARMNRSMQHRGPDDNGVWIAPDAFCGLAHQRLSIIDTTAAGHQPMLSADQRSIVVFNGELYNFEELRQLAADGGAMFRGHSDTEILLEGLNREGVGFLKGVDAMFALGWYDIAQRQLLLARDTFGEKPLYYTLQNGVFAFASELHALTLLPGFDPTISIDTVSLYLAFQHPPAPHTIYQHCRKLAPGHCLRVDQNGPSAPFRHHHFICEGNAETRHSIEERADQLEEILLTSLRRRLKSDVPLGAFLSGGVDSSTAVALITKRLNRSIKTFSIGFSGVADSEHGDAEAMARHLGTDHYCEMMDPADFAAQADLAVALDEPNLDSSCVPTLAISALARRHVTVAITGDGGDEMFGGYGRYWQCLAALERNRASDPGRDWSLGQEYLSRRFLVFTEQQLSEIFGPRPLAAKDLLFACHRRVDQDVRPEITRLRELDVDIYLPVVLAKVDRMSMQHSLECRTPYLSPDVATFAASLTRDELCVGSDAKRVLRALARRYFPQDWIARPKKGFGVEPSHDEARAGILARLGTLTSHGDSALETIFPGGEWSRIRDHWLPRCGFYNAWAFLVLERWLSVHPWRIDRQDR